MIEIGNYIINFRNVKFINLRRLVCSDGTNRFEAQVIFLDDQALDILLEGRNAQEALRTKLRQTLR